MLDTKSLLNSPVVANCCMNRQRGLDGANSYGRELKLDLVAWLAESLTSGPVRWLDVCCGTGTALIEAAEAFGLTADDCELSIEGIDLVGHFADHPFAPALLLHKTSLEDWIPSSEYDLITCVHGLHYVGDKLSAIRRLVGCLSNRGRFVANVDLSNFRFSDGRSAARTVAKRLREQGLVFRGGTRLLECHSKRSIGLLGLQYAGARDDAGPNYTGQSSVDSYYAC